MSNVQKKPGPGGQSQQALFQMPTKTGSQQTGEARQTTNHSAPEQTPIMPEGENVWYLWTITKIFHVEGKKQHLTVCGRQLDPLNWWRTPHKPLGQVICTKCQRSRGCFENQHKQQPLL